MCNKCTCIHHAYMFKNVTVACGFLWKNKTKIRQACIASIPWIGRGKPDNFKMRNEEYLFTELHTVFHLPNQQP